MMTLYHRARFIYLSDRTDQFGNKYRATVFIRTRSQDVASDVNGIKRP